MVIKIIDKGIEKEIDTNKIKIKNITLQQFLERFIKLENKINGIKNKQEEQDKTLEEANKMIGG